VERLALWEWSVLPKNTTQCPQPGLEPRPLDLETGLLTMRPLHLPILLSRMRVNKGMKEWIVNLYLLLSFLTWTYKENHYPHVQQNIIANIFSANIFMRRQLFVQTFKWNPKKLTWISRFLTGHFHETTQTQKQSCNQSLITTWLLPFQILSQQSEINYLSCKKKTCGERKRKFFLTALAHSSR